MNSNSNRCAACKHLRRRCHSDCIFSPYFPSNNPRRFSHVHKVYGASNVGKILNDLPVNLRAEAADSLYYEAHCRIKDPVYGCVGLITIMHQQIHMAQCELARIRAEIAAIKSRCKGDPFQQYQQTANNPQSRMLALALPNQNDVLDSNLLYDPSTWLN